jgi:uridine phosphorylase
MGKGPESDGVAVMVSTAPDFAHLKSQAGAGTCGPLFMGSVFTQSETGTMFSGPHMGAPYATMVLENLIARGAGTIFVFGWCGSISAGLAIGDIVVVEAGLSDEGTSKNYMETGGDFPLILPDPALKALLYNGLHKRKVPFKSGTVWTTDAIYRETPRKIEFFRDMGAVGVDMECAALFAVARFRGVKIAAILVVSDELSILTWKPGFKSKQFKAVRKQVSDLLLDLSRCEFSNYHDFSKRDQ